MKTTKNGEKNIPQFGKQVNKGIINNSRKKLTIKSKSGLLGTKILFGKKRSRIEISQGLSEEASKAIQVKRAEIKKI